MSCVLLRQKKPPEKPEASWSIYNLKPSIAII